MFNGDLTTLFNFPETMDKFMYSSSSGNQENSENRAASSIPVDILENSNEFVFFLDVPGLSKSDIQVTVEDDNILVIRSNGKRKREDGEDEDGCKFIRLERRAPRKLVRKFRLPGDADVSAISAKCENGVLTVVVGKLPPPPKPKTVEEKVLDAVAINQRDRVISNREAEIAWLDAKLAASGAAHRLDVVALQTVLADTEAENASLKQENARLREENDRITRCLSQLGGQLTELGIA